MSLFRTPVYSDSGWAVLGQVLQRLSGKSYPEALDEVLAKPLGLDQLWATTPAGPDLNTIDRTLVTNDTSWAVDFPLVTP